VFFQTKPMSKGKLTEFYYETGSHVLLLTKLANKTNIAIRGDVNYIVTLSNMRRTTLNFFYFIDLKNLYWYNYNNIYNYSTN